MLLLYAAIGQSEGALSNIINLRKIISEELSRRHIEPTVRARKGHG